MFFFLYVFVDLFIHMNIDIRLICNFWGDFCFFSKLNISVKGVSPCPDPKHYQWGVWLSIIWWVCLLLYISWSVWVVNKWAVMTCLHDQIPGSEWVGHRGSDYSGWLYVCTVSIQSCEKLRIDLWFSSL